MDVPQVCLPPHLREIQERWRPLHRKDQDELYAREFAAPFAPLFADLPLYGGPDSLKKPKALVSVLGFSWPPVAMMAAWCRPERMLVIGSEESLKLSVAGERVVSLIARVARIDRDAITVARAGDPGETDIYRAVRDFLASGISPREIFIDPTGGKKSMSASAALAGFLAGAPLVYVDYTEYHPQSRIPVPGSEYPRLLANPLEVLGDLDLRDVFAAFNRSDFDEAERLARRMASRLYEPREAEALAELAAGYAAWDRFQFEAARKRLANARLAIDAFAEQGGWAWVANVKPVLSRNLQGLLALEVLTKTPASLGEGLPLVVWYLAAAKRRAEANRISLAVLLLYAAMERFMGLCLRVDHGLDSHDPNYALIKDKVDWRLFDAAGKGMFGDRYRRREFDGPLMFANSVQLLAALRPSRLSYEDFGRLKGLARTRNKCEYENGFLPEPPKSIGTFYSTVKEIVWRCGEASNLDEMLARCEFPQLPEAVTRF